MDIWDRELKQRVIRKMRWERIEDFSDEELERVFADFDIPEEEYLTVVARLVDDGLTIDNLNSWDIAL
ncbi:MAG: hypothetical protein ABIQ40_00700 [Bacteroidia bacterium]